MIRRRHIARSGEMPAPRPILLPIVLFIHAVLMALWIAATHAQTVDPSAFGYVAGGVGADEMERMKARESEYNLKLVFTLVEGNYVSDVAVVIKDKAQNPVLVLFAPGPLVLAKLPPGAYSVEATYGASTQTRQVEVRERLRTEYLRWPSDPEADFPSPKGSERDAG
jgi:hypothetical protein